MTLSISTPECKGTYQGSKWLKFQLLCEAVELQALFERLRPFYLFPLTGVGEGRAIEESFFLNVWESCIASLKEGRLPEESALRQILASALTDDLEALWLQKVEGKGYLTKIAKPVIQLQSHWFTYSDVDRVFRPMSMGKGSVFWGIQFSYPQIYQDPLTMEFREGERGRLFEALRLWVREATRATPFCVNGEKVHVPIRLGKKCFDWIGRHPQLIEQGIGVDCGAN